MSGVTGKTNSQLKKQDVQESKFVTTGVKNLVFWHEAQSTGETSIQYGSLNFPSAVVGETNPTATEILKANLGLFKNNVKVFSSLNGELMTGLTCLVKNSQITFLNGYTTTEGEIFKVEFKNQAITGTNVVDARPLTATGTLTAGQTEFNVGEAFQINAYPNSQMGEVMVFVDGEIQYRNVNNATAEPSADGNYQEVHASSGFGSVIKFNEPFASDQPIIVISRNLIAERPDISMMQLIESLGGQIDKLIEYVAQDIGVDPLIFQVGPNQIDLKAFGDLVYQNKQDIAANTALIDTKQDKFTIPYQIKEVLITTVSNNVTAMGFNSLDIGKKYRITIQHRVGGAGSFRNRVAYVQGIGGPTVLFSDLKDEGGQSISGGMSQVFTCTDSNLVCEFSRTTGTSNSTVVATLEELPNHIETSKWN